MRIDLLGPVEVWAGPDRVEVGTPRQRAVLAALAADAGRVVPVDTLVERVWGDHPPAGARRAVQSYLARLRPALARVGARLPRRPGGYLLDGPADLVDVRRFDRLVQAANEAAEPAAVLARALALWSGAEPLGGVEGAWAARMRAVWRQGYVDAAVAWARAALAGGGDPEAVVALLTGVAERYPRVEAVAAWRVRALAAAGRTGAALDLYAASVAELGGRPGAELRQARQEIARPAGPAMLPADLPAFVGRAEQLAALDGAAADVGERAAAAGVAGVVAITGTAGVGKTALAVHWAHRVAERFPGGQLYANLRGFDPTGKRVQPAQAVRIFLDALGVPPQRVPAGLDAQLALYRTELAGRRALIVLDNAGDADQVRPLLPGTAGALVLVTSRAPLTDLDGATPLRLDLFTSGEAYELLSRQIGAAPVAAEPAAVEEIITRCARLPLALAVAAARAATQPQLPLAALAQALRTEPGGLDALSAADDPPTDLRAAFALSYRLLDPEQRRLFRLLGLHPGPDVSAAAAASLADRPLPRAGALLAALTAAHLIGEHTPGRYAAHDLLRAYAGELAQAEDRTAALTRLLDHYLHTAYAAARLLNPHRQPIAIPPPTAAPQPLGDAGEALTWLAAEHQVLVAAIDAAADHGLDRHAWQLAWTLTSYLGRRGHWADWTSTQRAALAAADRLGDRTGQAHAHRNLARAYVQSGALELARRHGLAALELFTALGDQVGAAYTRLSLAVGLEREGEVRTGLEHTLRAVELFRAAGEAAGEADALNAVGWNYALLGEYDQALAHCEPALALLRQVGDRNGEAATWDSIGYAHHHLGRHRQAVECYRRSIELWRQIGDLHYEASTLANLGDAQQAAGDTTGARASWRAAYTILRDLDHPDAADVLARLGAEPPA